MMRVYNEFRYIMDIDDIAVFVAAQAGGSLASAARQLGITAMAASRKLASLEHELGARLMHRTTRAVSLTPEGEDFLPLARTMLDAAEEARGILTPTGRSAQGRLRATAPAAFGRLGIMPLIPSLMREHPELRIELLMSDEVIDLNSAGIDVAIRIAPLRDSELVARPLAVNPRVLCAAPSYLAARAAPQLLSDLTEHECLALSNMQYWPFVDGKQERSVRVDGRFVCSSVEGVRTACVQGLGIALLTVWDIQRELSDGTLVSIGLSDVQPQELSIWALLPTRKYVPQRVRVFLDALERSLTNMQGGA